MTVILSFSWGPKAYSVFPCVWLLTNKSLKSRCWPSFLEQFWLPFSFVTSFQITVYSLLFGESYISMKSIMHAKFIIHKVLGLLGRAFQNVEVTTYFCQHFYCHNYTLKIFYLLSSLNEKMHCFCQVFLLHFTKIDFKTCSK